MGKAEFAADLNNLSNRMAQLENSLDAKIDSLVSSYLTRNGIWNGAKQDIQGSSVTFNSGNVESRFLKNITAGIEYKNLLHEWDFNSNKAGMLFVLISLNCPKPSNVGSWRPCVYYQEGNKNNPVLFRVLHSFSFQVKNDDNLIYKNVFVSTDNGLNMNSYDGTQWYVQLMTFPTSAAYVVQCFVSKSNVKIDILEETFSGMVDYSVSEYSFCNSGGSLSFTIDSAVVY